MRSQTREDGMKTTFRSSASHGWSRIRSASGLRWDPRPSLHRPRSVGGPNAPDLDVLRRRRKAEKWSVTYDQPGGLLVLEPVPGPFAPPVLEPVPDPFPPPVGVGSGSRLVAAGGVGGGTGGPSAGGVGGPSAAGAGGPSAAGAGGPPAAGVGSGPG